MSIYKIFFQSFLTLFIGFILLINLDMYVSYVTGYTNFLGANPPSGSWDFDTYYFGFRSVLNAFENLADICDVGGFVATLNNMRYYISRIPIAVSQMQLNDITSWWNGFVSIAVAFINVFGSFCELFTRAFQIVASFFYWLLLVISGAYNTPIPIIS